MNKKLDMFHHSLYRFYISRASAHHCMLRLRLSTLNSQRFQYGFFFCPAFAAQRLIEGLTALLPTAVMQNKQSLLNILLYGSDNFPDDTNCNIFTHLQVDISSSKRFSYQTC